MGKIFIGMLFSSLFVSCASSFPVHLLCDERDAEIYVDGQHIGRGQVVYTVPKGIETIKVSCRSGGLEVYSREYYVKDKKNQLLEISIPKDYRYSFGNFIKSKSY